MRYKLQTITLFSCLFVLSISLSVDAQNIDSDQWSATDALERKVSEYPDAGDKREKYEIGRAHV